MLSKQSVLVAIATASHLSDAPLSEADRIPRASQMQVWWWPLLGGSPLHLFTAATFMLQRQEAEVLRGVAGLWTV